MGRLILLTLLFFFRIALPILVLLPFYRNFRIILSVSTKSLAVNLIRILLNLYINLGKVSIFTMLNLTVHEYLSILL